ncbi:hypothetical protein [Streptomyces atriruber]|uniref:hypothetical protein n=1 Tax=Streptomyces atriruber TaxID=545121 RepID=UPI0012FEE7D6|nr:hypothetical protein [Streptomyces atriruber]
MLARDGFEGPRYEQFVEELVRYAQSVLSGWMRMGRIFREAGSRGFGGLPHDAHDLEELARDAELRKELAMMTIARALPRFRDRALIAGDWKEHGGARLTTYFVGTCLLEFANEFRQHRNSQERQRRAVGRLREVGYEAPSLRDKAFDEVDGNLWVLEFLKGIEDSRTQAVLALISDGYSHEEIRHILDASSVRAIEGLLHRWRKKQQRGLGEEDDV